MKLSEAIRLGSLVTTPIRGMLMTYGDRACALGAACVAMGFSDLNALNREFPILKKKIQHSYLGAMTVSILIVKMNDLMGYTREQIADYIERMENQDGNVESTARNQEESNVLESTVAVTK